LLLPNLGASAREQNTGWRSDASQRLRSFAAAGRPHADWHQAVACPGGRGAHRRQL